jgi:hypothetical protein
VSSELRIVEELPVFLKLHYTSEPGREFLINVAAIAGIEINGTPDKGCVLTLTTPDKDGEPKYETVRETFEEIERALAVAGLMLYC